MSPALNNSNPSIVEPLELDLVLAAAGGDRDARRSLFERFRDQAFQVAMRVTGRSEDALDVVQDAFIKAFDSLAGFQRDAAFKTWLLRIVTNRALDVLRARKVRLAASLDAGDDERNAPAPVDRTADHPGDALERRELEDRVAAAVETLPAEQRAVFALYATGELTYGEIAETLGVPIGTVMSRLYHARQRLKEQLKDLEA